MSYYIMADERLKALFVPFDPMDERIFLNNDIIILCNKEKMKRLSGVNYILMDGTFNVAPHGFIQMYTIHGAFLDKSHFTMFYVLMRKRRADDYERLFSRLQQYCVQEFNFTLFNKDRTVITDYENAVFIALRPYGCNMQGCFFHFTQCVYRKVKQIGLSEQYKVHKSVVHLYVRLLMLSAYIKPPLKGAAFNDLVRSFSAEDVDDDTRTKMTSVFNYFKITWLNGCYDVKLWSFSGTEMNTNNICESFHSGLTTSFPYISHPNMFTFANMIYQYERKNMNVFVMSTTTAYESKKQRGGKTIADTLTCLNARYADGRIQSLKEYLEALNISIGNSIDSATAATGPRIDVNNTTDTQMV